MRINKIKYLMCYARLQVRDGDDEAEVTDCSPQLVARVQRGGGEMSSDDDEGGGTGDATGTANGGRQETAEGR